MTDTTETTTTDDDDAAATRDGTGHPPTRQCGRCRLHFPIAAETHPMELRDWWACSSCEDALIPRQRRGPTSNETQDGSL